MVVAFPLTIFRLFRLFRLFRNLSSSLLVISPPDCEKVPSNLRKNTHKIPLFNPVFYRHQCNCLIDMQKNSGITFAIVKVENRTCRQSGEDYPIEIPMIDDRSWIVCRNE